MIMLAIILGAFGAHALKDILSTERLASFETGVKYQMYHGLAFLIVGLLADRFSFGLNRFLLSDSLELCSFLVPFIYWQYKICLESKCHSWDQ